MDNAVFDKTKDELSLLYREIYLAKSQYVVFENIYNNLLNSSENDKLIHTKKSVFDALEYSILLKLAKIYDIDDSGQSLTLHKILNKIQCTKILNKDNEKIKHYVQEKLNILIDDELVKKIKFFRDKNVAHLDKTYKIGLKGMHKDCPLTLNDIKTLLENAYDIIKTLLKSVFSTDYGSDKIFEIIQLECESCEKELYLKSEIK